MVMSTKYIKIQHEELGVLLNEAFINPVQFKLFLKMINGCISNGEALTFFNGEDFFINIPNKILKNSVITTTTNSLTLTDHVITKSKIEQPA